MKARRLRSRTGLAVVLALALLLSAAPLAVAAPDGLDPSFDRTPPTAHLVKPAEDEYKGAAFVTGKDFLLVGTAEDESGIKDTWFELCPEGTPACLKDWNSAPGDDNWRAIGGVPAEETPGMPGQYQTTWDSTTVSDGFYLIRFCAEDNAGNGNCTDGRADLPLVDGQNDEHFNPYPDAHWVYVNNRVACELLCAGWHLVSTPLMPYDTDIEDVLAELIAHGTVEVVWTMVYEGDPPTQVWKVWTPTAGPVDTLTNIVDGRGYWVKMKAPDTWNILGTWTTLGDGETPPAYPVYAGWNLFGYTHWGRPTIWPADEVGDYLGARLMDDLPLLFTYDPCTDIWTKLYEGQGMELCKGYWVSATEPGVIRF